MNATARLDELRDKTMQQLQFAASGREREEIEWRLGLLQKLQPDGECLVWKGPVRKDGWPAVVSRSASRYVQLRRILYELMIGPLPSNGTTQLRSTCACRRKTCCTPWKLVDSGFRKAGARRRTEQGGEFPCSRCESISQAIAIFKLALKQAGVLM